MHAVCNAYVLYVTKSPKTRARVHLAGMNCYRANEYYLMLTKCYCMCAHTVQTNKLLAMAVLHGSNSSSIVAAVFRCLGIYIVSLCEYANRSIIWRTDRIGSSCI